MGLYDNLLTLLGADSSGGPAYRQPIPQAPSPNMFSKSGIPSGSYLDNTSPLTKLKFHADDLAAQLPSVLAGLAPIAEGPLGLAGYAGLNALGGLATGQLEHNLGNDIDPVQRGLYQSAGSTLGLLPGKPITHLLDAKAGTYKINPSDVLKQLVLNLKKTIPTKDVHGNPITFNTGDPFNAYELKNGKVLLKNDDEFLLSKNQYQNIRGNSITDQVPPFAPELGQTQETVKGMSIPYTTLPEGYKIKHTPDLHHPYSVLDETDNFILGGGTEQEATQSVIDSLNRYTLPDRPTEYHDYQLPGGENYKELLIRAQDIGNKFDPSKVEIKRNRFSQTQGSTGLWYDGKRLGEYGDDPILADGGQYYQKPDEHWMKVAEKLFQVGDEINGIKPLSGSFKSSHWDEPNILAHLRLNQRDYMGQPVTFLEELQSDWASKGRKEGFKTGNYSDLDQRRLEIENKGLNATPAEKQEWADIKNKLTIEGKGVPNHPLLKDWQGLALKRALKEAVDNNSEYLSWTTGEQQAARYDLSKHVDKITWKPNPYDDKVGTTVSIRPREGHTLSVIVDNQGNIIKSGDYAPDNWHGKHLSEVIGKEPTHQIIDSPSGNLAGEGLKIGGEWTKNLYDNQVKNIVEKLTGGMVEPLDLGLYKEGRPLNKFVDPVTGHNITTKDIAPGKHIISAAFGNQEWIVTSPIKSNGRFDVVSKDMWRYAHEYLKDSPDKIPAYLSSQSSSFAVTDPVSQQGIRLTPEIRAKILGQVDPNFKMPSGIPPWEGPPRQ